MIMNNVHKSTVGNKIQCVPHLLRTDDTRVRSLVCEDIPSGRRNVGRARERLTTKKPGTSSTLLLITINITSDQTSSYFEKVR
jgi:hypothetical protein